VKKTSVLLSLALVTILPEALNALTDSEIQNRREISQVWVDQHNGKLPADVRGYVQHIRAKKHAYFVPSRHKHVVPLKRVRFGVARKYRIPLSVKSRDAAEVPLAALRLSKAAGENFLTADYADDYDNLHASTDIYIQIGLQYKHLFHGEGYPGSARVITLGKDSPVFFEVNRFGGGARCDRVLYRLDTDALKGKSDELYDHPELIDVQKYVKEELQLNVWLEGFTLYKDLAKDGKLEIANCTQTEYPNDLKEKVEDRYKMVDNDFAGPFRPVISFYRWDDAKAKFEDLGDYYY
jgi:hypothetical protein